MEQGIRGFWLGYVRAFTVTVVVEPPKARFQPETSSFKQSKRDISLLPKMGRSF